MHFFWQNMDIKSSRLQGVDSAWNIWSANDGTGKHWCETFLDLYDLDGLQTSILDVTPIECKLRSLRKHADYTEGCELLVRRVFAYVLSHEVYHKTGEVRRCDAMFVRLNISVRQETFVINFVKQLNKCLQTTTYADPGREVERILRITFDNLRDGCLLDIIDSKRTQGLSEWSNFVDVYGLPLLQCQPFDVYVGDDRGWVKMIEHGHGHDHGKKRKRGEHPDMDYSFRLRKKKTIS